MLGKAQALLPEKFRFSAHATCKDMVRPGFSRQV